MSTPTPEPADRSVVTSPLHRDPALDGDDYGCFTRASNRRVAALVVRLRAELAAGTIASGEDLIAAIRAGLEAVGARCRGCGATDTTVKENVRNALRADAADAGLAVVWWGIYGW